MIATISIAPEIQPGFGIFCAVVVFLSGVLFLTLNALSARSKIVEPEGLFSRKAWLRNIYVRGLDALSKFEIEAAETTSATAKQLDLKAIGVVVLACVSITILNYYGFSTKYRWLEPVFSRFGAEAAYSRLFETSMRSQLGQLAYWSIATFSFYFILPAIFVKFVLKESLSDFGLTFKGLFDHLWIYIGLYVIVLPFVTAVSTTSAFQSVYPFYHHADLSVWDFLAWEAIYTLQFFALEFFYRGFLVHGLKHRFGYYSILVSVIPYCMIHFGKPMPEALGAIVAGLALGMLSLSTRSIWLGVLIHLSVAFSMDFLSLAGQGRL